MIGVPRVGKLGRARAWVVMGVVVRRRRRVRGRRARRLAVGKYMFGFGSGTLVFFKWMVGLCVLGELVMFCIQASEE